MDIIGAVLMHHSDADLDPAELKRLGLDKQAKHLFVDHKDDERDDYDLMLFGDGSLLLNFPNQANVMLDRQETARLFTFMSDPHIKKALYKILRASLIERGNADLLAELEALSPEHRQAILWAFGRAEKPAFLGAA